MQADLLAIDFEAELRSFQAQRAKDRTKGRHLSEIIHRIVMKTDPGRFSDEGIDPTQVHIGFLWEDVLSWVMTRQLGGAKQIELLDDGIYTTLDGFSAKRWRVIEVKATKASARNPIRSQKFWHWHIQIQEYCRRMSTTEAELIPLFVNGAYEMGGGRFGKIRAVPYLMTYSKREMLENWDMIRRERDDMDREEAA
jgi:hypothetical protein